MAETPSPSEIRSAARELLAQALHRDEPVASFAPRAQRDLINESDVAAAKARGGVLLVPPGAIVTPLARDAAERYQVELRYASPSTEPSAAGASPSPASASGDGSPEPSPSEQGGAIAVGSDHGGFKLKEAIKRHLASRGFTVLDQGTTSDAACDYPDLAARVARAVSLGEARWGVFVDGAGIGGAMTLNRVPGVLAATCHDEKAAQNARGHNAANVLCLGSSWVDEPRARAVVDAFLSTGFEGGRHARRVAKIRALERAFLGRHS